MQKLTPKQQEILNFIEDFIENNGYPPSVREIGKGVNLSSSSSVYSQLNNLEAKGYIKKNAETSRAIILTKEIKKSFLSVPMVGLVTAGNPIEAIENVSDYFPIPSSLASTSDTVFALKVSGDSMKNAGILDNDTIIVKKTDVANNGEIVVALTDDNEATVKRFYKEHNHYRLQPENDAYEPIILKSVKIIGKVIGVFRDLS
ncbi:MAG TPA: transcriptional repressor LexA [Haloplasmataceae bacterium]